MFMLVKPAWSDVIINRNTVWNKSILYSEEPIDHRLRYNIIINGIVLFKDLSLTPG